MHKLVLGVALIYLVLNDGIAQEDNLAIEQRLVSYQRCLLDTDCNENSFCYNNDNVRVGLCKCVAGYELLFRNRTHYACLKLAKWGEECVQTNQCIDSLGSLAKCDGTCKCSDGTYRYPWDGRCHEAVLLDNFCKTDANCILADGSYAFCTDGQCVCNIGFRPSHDKTTCIQARNLGQSCTDNKQCSLVQNSVCREVCRCAMGYVVSRNGSICLKAATYFSEPCEENDQCSEFLKNSACVRGKCTCQDGYHSYENTCARSVEIGQPCQGTEECIPSGQFVNIAGCIEGVCQCQPGVTNERMGCNSSSFKININVLLIGFCSAIYYLFFLRA